MNHSSPRLAPWVGRGRQLFEGRDLEAMRRLGSATLSSIGNAPTAMQAHNVPGDRRVTVERSTPLEPRSSDAQSCRCYSTNAKGRYDAATLSRRVMAWDELWAAQGYIVLLVDGCGPRGASSRPRPFRHRLGLPAPARSLLDRSSARSSPKAHNQDQPRRRCCAPSSVP
jgi:hypothetical protein